MDSSYSPQTTIKGHPFRVFDERWPAEDGMPARLLRDRPSAAKVSRKMLRHWRSKASQVPLIRRPA
jgi:hypothetical protein